MHRQGEDDPRKHDQADALLNEIKRVMRGKTFAKPAEANAFIAPIVQRQNQTPRDDFQGLSSERMFRLLHFPFDSPDLVTFAETPAESLAAPIIRLFALLVEAVGEQGLKPTATGNLPRKVVRETALAYWGEEQYRENTRLGNPRTELDFFDMHITRLLAGMAGLIRKYKGKFIVPRACRTLLAKGGYAGAYPRLLRAYAIDFNWAYYYDSLNEVPHLQQSFLYTAYLLQRFGDQWRDTTFYEDAFLRAFPQTLDEIVARSYSTPEDIARRIYTSRSLMRFAKLMGLTETRPLGNRTTFRYEIRASPLLRDAIRFTL